MKKYPDHNNLSQEEDEFVQPDLERLENNDESDPTNDFEDESIDEGQDTMEEETSQPEGNEESTDENESETEQDKQSESSSSEHDGKYFVVQKGMACCDKGAKFPNFKVTSHQKHFWNDEKGEVDYLAVTEDDLIFNPPAMPFGTCSVKNGNPCAYAPAGKWTKTYDKVKVMGKSAVTEISELMCATGGKITVMKHGQQSEAGKSNVNNANSQEQQAYNPIVDFEEFQEEMNPDSFEVE
ncbi:PAAR-like protein [Epilithonimonas ginsengisoli]|uniref:PAAR-like protein n=1 Tax=Epilithonimonas ginsengisoli TaxID=1245592 RepID=A0ABU4JDH3_9FLAO|nr:MULTISPECIES: PAAR-like protein [Chryseobacterium group]MDW8547720.1 PAAR-like protein [Epilithonimonas ginsengisoli]